MGKLLTDEQIDTAYELAAKGMGRYAIAEHIGVAPSSCYRGRLGDSIKEGYKIARLATLTEYLDTAKGNPQMLENLVKRLGVFTQPLQLTKPKDAKDIPALLVDALELYKTGAISSSQLVVVQNWCDRYVKAVEVANLIPRIEALEAADGD